RVFVRYQLLPIDAPLTHRPTKACGVLEVFAEMRGVNQKFLRDAADVDTGAAQISFFRQCDFGAVGGGHTAGAYTAGTRTDGEEVVIVLRHVVILLSLVVHQ